MPTRREALKTVLAAAASIPAAAQPAPAAKVTHVDIIHHSHTDVGFTDMPSVTRELQVGFLDAAVEACLRNPHFRWTAEAMVTVDDWWRFASPARRSDLLRVVKSGQMDIMALPFNQAPFMNAMQWRQALEWVPPALLRDLDPRAAMQNDVNGFPRAGAMLLLDRGIKHLLMGINADNGGAPFFRPSAFWWKMPDERKIFVWLGEHYGTAYSWFEPKGWQQGQAKAANATLRPPHAGDHLRTGEASLRASHAHFISRLQRLEDAGYAHPRLILSYTNSWRYDNDAPFPPLAPFIDAWNRLGLQPELRFTTATQAVLDMERAVSSAIPTQEGEWTDWWANGDASGPREVAASRAAKRSISAALAPVWGEPTPAVKTRVEAMLKDLCLFDEHTWGANISISEPDALDTIAQYTEKSLLAYRPMGHAEWLLGQRSRTRLFAEPEGLYAINATRLPYSGWATFQTAALREYAKPPRPGAMTGEMTSVWLENLAPGIIHRISPEAIQSPVAPPPAGPNIETDPRGWPASAMWPGMAKPLFAREMGDFLAVVTVPPADRGTIHRIHTITDDAAREKARSEALKRVPATYGAASMQENPHTLVYTQPIEHPRLEKATRRLELWRREPRARLTVRFDRISSVAPEVLYINFAFPLEGVMPRVSNGGVPFTPYTDQLEGACRDYCAIDSWAHYQSPGGHWLWVTRDAPLVSVGGPYTLMRRTAAPPDTHRLCAMVFDNHWHTNFVANSHGTMEFQFELAWRDSIANPDDLADTFMSEPVLVMNAATPESPELRDKLFKP